MTALIATIGRATAWFAAFRTRRSEPECQKVGGLWEMLSAEERAVAFNFEGDDTISQR